MLLLEFTSHYSSAGRQTHRVIINDIETAALLKQAILKDAQLGNVKIVNLDNNKELFPSVEKYFNT